MKIDLMTVLLPLVVSLMTKQLVVSLIPHLRVFDSLMGDLLRVFDSLLMDVPLFLAYLMMAHVKRIRMTPMVDLRVFDLLTDVHLNQVFPLMVSS